MNEDKLHNIQLSDIELFLSVAKHKNFTKTAEKFFMSQPGVSKRISQIEKELGLKLFTRSKREVNLTPAGKLLEDKFSNIIAGIQEAITDARALQGGTSEILKIAYLHWDNLVLFKHIKTFIHQNPQFDVTLNGFQFKELHDQLLKNQVDIIFTTSYDCADFKNCRYNIFKIYTVPLILCISKDNPLAKKEMVSFTDLENVPVLTLNQKASSGYTNFISDLFKKYDVKLTKGTSADSGIEHLGNVLLDKGVFFTTSYIPLSTYNEEIVQRPVKNEVIYIVAITSKENKSHALKEFLDFILPSEKKR